MFLVGDVPKHAFALLDKTQSDLSLVIIDRARELRGWVSYTVQIIRRGIPVFIYVNNHYAGHATATARHFRDLYQTLQEPKY